MITIFRYDMSNIKVFGIPFGKVTMIVPGKFWKYNIRDINRKYMLERISCGGELEWKMLKVRVKN